MFSRHCYFSSFHLYFVPSRHLGEIMPETDVTLSRYSERRDQNCWLFQSQRHELWVIVRKHNATPGLGSLRHLCQRRPGNVKCEDRERKMSVKTMLKVEMNEAVLCGHLRMILWFKFWQAVRGKIPLFVVFSLCRLHFICHERIYWIFWGVRKQGT